MNRAVPYTPLAVITVLWVLLFGPLLGFGAQYAWRDHLFATAAQHVQGTVVRKYLEAHHGKGGTSYIPHVVYQFDTGIFTVTARSTVRWSTWRQIQPGESVPVKFLAGSPGISRIDRPEEDRAAWADACLTIFLGSVVFLAGGAGLIYTRRRNQLHERLIHQGIPCVGRVAEICTENPSGKQVRMFLDLAFTDHRGRELEGRTWDLRPNQESRWAQNDPVRIYYNSEDSNIFTVDLEEPQPAA